MFSPPPEDAWGPQDRQNMSVWIHYCPVCANHSRPRARPPNRLTYKWKYRWDLALRFLSVYSDSPRGQRGFERWIGVWNARSHTTQGDSCLRGDTRIFHLCISLFTMFSKGTFDSEIALPKFCSVKRIMWCELLRRHSPRRPIIACQYIWYIKPRFDILRYCISDMAST